GTTPATTAACTAHRAKAHWTHWAHRIAFATFAAATTGAQDRVQVGRVDVGEPAGFGVVDFPHVVQEGVTDAAVDGLGEVTGHRRGAHRRGGANGHQPLAITTIVDVEDQGVEQKLAEILVIGVAAHLDHPAGALGQVLAIFLPGFGEELVDAGQVLV